MLHGCKVVNQKLQMTMYLLTPGESPSGGGQNDTNMHKIKRQNTASFITPI